MSAIDLHSHSSASDGSLTPTELVEAAAAAGLRILGLTDHDTTDGLAEAARAADRLGLELVPGIELTTERLTEDGELQADILGYFIDPAHPELKRVLAAMRSARVDRARAMVDKMRGLGASIRFEDLEARAGDGVITRPHVAHALVETGFVEDVGAAFYRYIGRGRPAYVNRYRLTPEQACRLIRGAGGVPVLAHPVPNGDPYSDPLGLRHFLPPLVEAGLGGLECYYWRYTRRVNRWLEALAWHFDLVPTGGSDYHGPWRENQLGAVEVPPDTVDRLRAVAEAKAAARG